MSSSNGGKGGSGDKHNNQNKGKSSSSGITSDQKARLEMFFERLPHPNKTQEDQLARFLGLQGEQVAKWFHERRTQQVSQPKPIFPTLNTSRDLQFHEVPNSSRSPTPSVDSDEDDDDIRMEKARMLEIAKGAHEELCKLLQENEPLWVRASSQDRRRVLDDTKYKTMFPRDSDPNVFKTPYTRKESSKASMIVDMTNAMEMVEAFLDPKEMTEFFPTMIQRAEIIKEYEHGEDGTKHGALLLMYLETHHLSHLVPPRKYFFLRYCEKVHECGMWVICDVSLDSFGSNLPHLPCWKLPSGCLIYQMPTHSTRNNAIMVKWIEHVEVNDMPQTSLLYGDLVANNIPYSADRWVRVLQRNAEKLYYAKTSPNEADEVIKIEGRRSLLHISHRMLQSFCEILNMSCKPQITHFNKTRNDNNNDFEIKYSVRKNSAQDHPTGMIASLATSFWIPHNFYHVFHFLTDATKRNQWDPLCGGHSAFEVASIETGRYDGNRLSIIRPQAEDPEEQKGMVILEESSIDSVAAYIVSAPIERKKMQRVMAGRDDSVSWQLPILPSGFVLTKDAHLFSRAVMPNQQGGTLLTMASQILVSTTPSTKELNMKDLEIANNIFRTMVNNVKAALDCSGMN